MLGVVSLEQRGEVLGCVRDRPTALAFSVGEALRSDSRLVCTSSCAR
jgi:hypothetical protein